MYGTQNLPPVGIRTQPADLLTLLNSTFINFQGPNNVILQKSFLQYVCYPRLQTLGNQTTHYKNPFYHHYTWIPN